MQAKLVINGVDFAPFIVEGGIVQSDVDRQTTQVITLDGTLLTKAKRARGIRVTLRTLRDNFFQRAFGVLQGAQVVVTYTDRDTGQDATETFYVRERTAGIKHVKGGNTYWSNAGFYLEAKHARGGAV